MPKYSADIVPTFDRFGWYWQPEKWLEGMTPEDALRATQKAINIEGQAKALEQQAKNYKDKTAAFSAEEQKILDSLWDGSNSF